MTSALFVTQWLQRKSTAPQFLHKRHDKSHACYDNVTRRYKPHEC